LSAFPLDLFPAHTLALLLAALVILISTASLPSRRAKEPLRRPYPATVPPDIASDWRKRMERAYEAVYQRRFPAVLDALVPTRPWISAYGPNRLSGRTLAIAGGAHYGMRNYPAALKDLMEARRILRQIDDREALASVALQLAGLYREILAYPEAIESSQEAHSLLPRGSTPRDRARPLLDRALLLMARGLPADAVPLLHQAVESAGRTGDDLLAADSWEILGRAFLAQGDLGPADRAIGQAFRLRWTLRDPLLPRTHAKVALLRSAQSDYAASERFLRQAFLLRDVQAMPDWTLTPAYAESLERAGNQREAYA